MARFPDPLPFLKRVGRWLRDIETGVRWFLLFIVLAVAGFLLMLADLVLASVIAGVAAIASILLMAFARPRYALERERAEMAVAQGKGGTEAAEGERPITGAAPTATAAPTTPRARPAPPPEPPAMDLEPDLVIEAPPLEPPTEEPPAEEEEGIWVEA